MELNKNSKWLKFYLKFNSYRPSNFCEYFWGSIKSLLISIFLISLIFIAGCILIAPITLLFFNPVKGSFWEFCQIFGIFIYVAIILGLIIYKIITYFENKPYKSYKKSIIKTWYKDFKNKHCTLITWKD